MRTVFLVGAALALLSACNSETEHSAASDVTTAEATAEAAAPATAPNVDLAALTPGTMVEATRQAKCRETGPNAGEPWDVAPGSFAKVVAVEGNEVRVDMVGTECLIAADAVKPS
jgi:hypothetical protein